MEVTRICKECGKEFIATHPRRQYCYDDHYRTCSVCGTSFLVPFNKLNSSVSTCSEQCRRAAIGQTTKSRRNVERELVCKICGKKYTSTKSYPRICPGEHLVTCQFCGKEFSASIQQLESGTKTCSNECRYNLMKSSYSEHFSDPEEHKKLWDKTKATMMERYGVDNAMKSKEFQKKAQATCLEKYGETSFTKTAEFVERTTATNRKKFGVDWYMQTDECKEAFKKTSLERYGVDNPAKSSVCSVDRMRNPECIDNLLEFRKDPSTFISSHFDYSPTLLELSKVCGIAESSVGDILYRVGGRDLVSYCFSRMEEDIYLHLVTLLGKSATIERNTFQVITPYELDIYLPEYGVGIECNPTITHNSTIPGFWENDEPKSIVYHKMKSDLCRDKGIFLFHIFGYEWNHKQDIIYSMIANLLHKTSNKIYARDTDIREVSFNDSKMFLNKNHRQGSSISRVRLGLYHQDKLVSLMTFSKMRNTIGTGSEDLEDCWELTRFCNQLNTSVVGGASKLFKAFIRRYNPVRIRSFSDAAHTKGTLYRTLGFQYLHTSEPNYVWVNLKTDVGYNRLNTQKQNLSKFLDEPDLDLTRTEVEIMTERGYVQVFDSGTCLWEWTSENFVR